MAKIKQRPYWSKKRYILPLVVAAFLVGSWNLPNFPVGPFWLYSDLTDVQRTAKPYFKTLATNKSHPFLYGGAGKQFHASMKRFPTVKDCLVRSERSKEVPDLRLIDWHLFWRQHDPTVCIWRIFSSLGTPEAAANWLKFHGFKLSENLDPFLRTQYVYPQKYDTYPRSLATVKNGTKIDVIRVYGSMGTKDRYPPSATGIFKRLMVRIFVHGHSISAQWTSSKELLRVYVGYTIL